MEVTLLRRAVHLAIQGFFLLPGLVVMIVLGSGLLRLGDLDWDVGLIAAIPLLWVLWAGIAGGGMSFSLAGISLVRGNGLHRVASGSACGHSSSGSCQRPCCWRRGTRGASRPRRAAWR